MEKPEETQVGPNIRAIRERKGLSLRALSEQSGLSVNAISLIERGENSPTVSSLRMLSSALGVPITYFFQEDHDQAVVHLTPGGRMTSRVGGISMESLGIGLRQQQLEPFLVTIDVGVGNVDQPVAHAGEEFVYVLEGTVEYSVDGTVYQLEAGGSLLFDATLHHCFRNTGGSAAKIVMVFFAGESGHVARRMHMEARLKAMVSGQALERL
jgi:mannose-6-phosphate isomerase-like protein (cupin superfamily)